jgi:nitroreductase
MTSPEDVVNLICGRRSVRSGYNDRTIPRLTLERIVLCGLAAPCSKRATPWRFTVVTDRRRLADLAVAVKTAPGVDDYVPHDPRTGLARPELGSTVIESANVLAEVAAGVFIENAGPFSGGRRALLNADPSSRELAMIGFELELAGLGAALENMWLAAIAEGLSAAFMGDVGVAEPAIKLELGIRGDLLGVLVVGYADQRQLPLRRSPDASSLVRWDP